MESENLSFPDVLEYTYELRYRVKLATPKRKGASGEALNQAVRQIHSEIYGDIIIELSQISSMMKYSPKQEIEELVDTLLSRLESNE